MANTVIHKQSAVAAKVPTTAQFAQGELAINTTDKKLYAHDGTTVFNLASRWTDQTGGVSRSDKIKVGAAAAPAVAVDVTGTVGQNAQATTGAVDASTGQVWTATIAGATTFTITGTIPNSTTLVLKLTNGGSAVITWPASIKWPGGTAPTLTAAGVDVVTLFTADGGTTWYGNTFALDGK